MTVICPCPKITYWPPGAVYREFLIQTSGLNIAGWEEERSGPTGKSFRFVRACVRAVIVKWK